jgi:hypothetical protein
MRIGLWTILFGAICEALVILWIVSSEVPAKVFISSWSVVMPGILLLTLFMGLRRLFPNRIARHSLLIMYAMLAASSCLVGYGAIQAMYPAIATQFYEASSTNNFADFNKYMPPWLIPRSHSVLRGLFIGHASVPWHAWIIPMLAWGGLLTGCAFAMLALSILLSRVWIRDERLTFPIAQLPLEITSLRNPLFSNRLFWAGFCIPVILESLLALNYYYPSIPAIQVKHVDYGYLWPNPPWNALAPFYIGFTPFIIGFAYLVPTDISFSVFFFGLLDRLIQVATVRMGGQASWPGSYPTQMPFSQQQTIGAFLAFALVPLFRAWPKMRKQLGDPASGLERGSLALLAVSVLGVSALLNAMGLSYSLAIMVVLLLLIFAAALTRIRAEAGPAWAFGPFSGLSSNLVSVTGSYAYSARELANLSTMQWMASDMRFLPMPFHMESLKIADSAGIPKGRMAAAILAATVLGIGTGLAAVLWWEYHLGIQSGKVYDGVSYWQQVVTGTTSRWINSPNHWDRAGAPWILIGALVTIALGAMRQQFLWWPFHPIGYVLAHTGTGLSFWMHYFIAWLLKTIVMRYGGMKFYRQSIPFVIGLILGDILAQTVWSAGAVLLHAPVYQFIT